jgi:hypothetical protein
MNRISEKVQDELNDAAGSIRNALNYASRTENPQTICGIAKILQFIEEISIIDQQVEMTRQFQDKLFKLVNKDEPPSSC